MSLRRQRRLSWLFGLFSAATVAALLGVALVAVRGLAVNHRTATAAAEVDLAALEDASALQALLYQKGFTAGYFLTGEQRWLDELARVTPAFERWLARVTKDARNRESADAVAALATEYGRYDLERTRSIEAYQQGDHAGAIAMMSANTERAMHLSQLASALIQLRRDEVRARLSDADRDWRRSLLALVTTIVAAILTAAISGYLLARRISRPLGELLQRAQSVAGGGVHRADTHDEIDAISVYVTRLAHQMAQAEKMSALGEMAAGVAHEVLNPLTGVKAALQVLQRNHPSGEINETVTAVDAEIRRVESMARRLVSFARPLQPAVVVCDLEAVARRAISATRAEATRSCTHIEVAFNGARTLHADPELLVQIMVNLIANACQATTDPPRPIRISARHEPGWDVLEVADEGSGLAPEIKERLFTPFVTTKPDGHGLGLAVSQNIALAHGGRIEARANDSCGTVFAVWLPEVQA